FPYTHKQQPEGKGGEANDHYRSLDKGIAAKDYLDGQLISPVPVTREAGADRNEVHSEIPEENHLWPSRRIELNGEVESRGVERKKLLGDTRRRNHEGYRLWRGQSFAK